MADNIHEAAIALQQDWDLHLPGIISEEEILKQLSARVLVLIDRGAEAFFQLMYRLDISEKKINAILNEDNVAEKIARLIYDRQLQKIKSRRENKSYPHPGDEDLQW